MVSAPRCPPGARGLLTLLLLLPLPGARASCGATPRLKSAVLSEKDEKKNFHANGATVSYVCRPGYESTELRPVITCLENSTWSEAPEFCRGKSCGVPKGPEHGRAVDTTNDRYGARVNIICDDGFRLRGRPFIQCMLKGDQVEWSQLPTCEALVIITQDKPTTVPPKGTEVAGTSSDIITQDEPITVPPEGAEVAGTSSEKQSTSDVCEMVPESREFTECGVPLEKLRTLLEVRKLYLEIEKLKQELK